MAILDLELTHPNPFAELFLTSGRRRVQGALQLDFFMVLLSYLFQVHKVHGVGLCEDHLG